MTVLPSVNTVISSLRHAVLPLLLTLALSVSGCQKGGDQKAEQPSGSASSAAENAGLRIEELLSALNMYQFPSPVKAPDFELESVQGGRVSLSQYRGKVVMLNFWATW